MGTKEAQALVSSYSIDAVKYTWLNISRIKLTLSNIAMCCIFRKIIHRKLFFRFLIKLSLSLTFPFINFPLICCHEETELPKLRAVTAISCNLECKIYLNDIIKTNDKNIIHTFDQIFNVKFFEKFYPPQVLFLAVPFALARSLALRRKNENLLWIFSK